MSSFAAEGRALERARPLAFRARAALRRGALAVLARAPRRRRDGVRIVHYHYVFDDEREPFERQLRFLAGEFEPVALSEAVERLRAGRVSGREVVVTFDDGFRNQAVNAAPLLARHGFPACFFLVTGFVGAPPEQAVRFCRERFHLPLPVEPLGWADVEQLVALGHEVGSHTRTHPDLTAVGADELAEELTASREELERRVGAIRHVSVPYGDAARFSDAIADAARMAGYASCSTAMRGRNTSAADVYALRRDHLSARWPLRDVGWFLS